MRVKFTEMSRQNYDFIKEKEVIIDGVVGNRNRGKSFVLSKLIIKTEGISIKHPKMEKGKEAKYILMDSEWFENVLLEIDDFTNDSNLQREDELKLLIIMASDFFILSWILFKKIIVFYF